MLVPGAASTAAPTLGRSGVAWNDLLGFVCAKYLVFCLERLLYCLIFFIVSIAFITKNKKLHSILEILNADEIWEKLQNNTLQIDVRPRNYGDCASWIFKFRKEFIRGEKAFSQKVPILAFSWNSGEEFEMIGVSKAT